MNHPRSIFIPAAALAVGLFLSGCASQNFESGTKLSADNVAQIKKGVTTRAEVEALLGPPAHVAIMPEGKRVMTYNYMSTKTSAHATAATFIPYVGIFAGGARGQNQTRTQTLQVMLTARGIVEDYEFNDDTSNTTTNVGGGLVGNSMSSTTSTSGTARSADDQK